MVTREYAAPVLTRKYFHIQRSTDDVLQVEHGSLYPALHRMERKGWLASRWESGEQKPPKTLVAGTVLFLIASALSATALDRPEWSILVSSKPRERLKPITGTATITLQPPSVTAELTVVKAARKEK